MEDKPKYYKVTIKGIKPLMHQRFPRPDEECVMSKKRKRAFNPKEECEKALYRDSEGRIYQPAIAIEGALRNSATDFIYKGKKSYKNIVESEIEVLPEKIYFTVPKDPEKYVCDIRSARNPNTRSRVWVARPRWDKWELTFYLINHATKEIDSKLLKEILDNAGRRAGIGTYRQKFGKFKVIEFKEVSEVKVS